MRHDLGVTSTPEPPPPHWPEHLPVGALRVTRWSSRYDETVRFYHDIIGLPLLETFRASYGLDGTILGLPGSRAHLEIVGLRDGPPPTPGRDDLVFYLPDAAARDHIVARLASAGVRPVAQIDYWGTTAASRSRTRTAARSYSSLGSTANEVIISATERACRSLDRPAERAGGNLLDETCIATLLSSVRSRTVVDVERTWQQP